MKSAVLHRLVDACVVSTRHGPRYVFETELIGESKRTFCISIKQGERLIECADYLEHGYSTKHSELHIVLDGERFVWCGIHSPRRSELDYLESRFGVVCDSPYIGRPDTSPREAAACLKDD
jgi:hypothetical protein